MQVTSRRTPWAVLAVTALGVFMVLLDSLIVIVAFPTLTRIFPGTHAADVSWVLNGYTIVYAALLVPAGRFADLVGRKRVFLVGVALFTAASGACAFSPTLAALVALRALQALGGALLSGTGLALTLAAFPHERRVMAVTIAAATGALAVAAAPSIGATLIALWGWRWIFLVNVPVGLGTLLVGTRILTESKDPERGARPDLAGIALLIGAATLGTYGIIESSTLGWGSPTVIGSLGGSLLLAVVTWREVRRSRAPIVDPQLFGNPSLRFAILGLLVYGAGFTILFHNSIYFLTEVWHYPLLTAAVALTPGPVTVVALAPLAGRLAYRYGHRALIVPGGLLFAIGPALLWRWAGTTPDYFGLWLPLAIVGGVGVALVLPALTSASVQELPPGRYAVGSGVGYAFRNFGAVVGASLAISFLAGASASSLGPYRVDWFVMVVVGVLTSAIALGIRTASRRAPAAATAGPAATGPADAGRA